MKIKENLMNQQLKMCCRCSGVLKRGTFHILLLFLLSNSLHSQTGPNKYWVQFTDKDNSVYSTERPEEFLSPRAIERRNRYAIEISEQDLPVNKSYTDSLRALGIEVLYTSKWFNAATVKSSDTLLLDTLDRISFIDGPARAYTIPMKPKKKKNTRAHPPKKQYRQEVNYDFYTWQLDMLLGRSLHDLGYQGENMIIAVLDGGFQNVDKLPALAHLLENDQIIDTVNFVDDSTSIYRTSSHGMKVLSILAGDIPGELLGTAPKADYVLIQSEDVRSEYIVEGDNWIAGVEYADSLGADVINSSLGYANFEDKRTSYTYEMLDGETARISLAADIASDKGMLVVTSAGNQGNKAWKYITAPADAKKAITVGAVDPAGQYVSFSSVGPSADGRIKPNVVALGFGTFIQELDNSVTYGSGTSFSSPVIAGLSACLWQAFPEATNMDIKNAIEMSASQAENPDSLLGYGIPNFFEAYNLLAQSYPKVISENDNVNVLPNPFRESLYIELQDIPDSSEVKLRLFSSDGRKLFQQKITIQEGYNLESINGLSVLPPGTYILHIKGKNINKKNKIIKY
jgi:serine protease AprX